MPAPMKNRVALVTALGADNFGSCPPLPLALVIGPRGAATGSVGAWAGGGGAWVRGRSAGGGPDGRAGAPTAPRGGPDPATPMQMHLDFDVDDLDATEARVLAAGATKYDVPPGDH